MLVSTSSMLYSVQSRFIFTRAAEREKEEREDMFYLSVDEGGGNNLSSSDSSSSSFSSSSDGLSSSGSSDGSSDEWGDPDPTWVVDENEEAMKREWREREKQKEMLRKRAEIKKRLKAERERRANALGALNAYHRKHHHHAGPAVTGTASGGGMSVVWDGEVGDEDHREEDMHDRKRDSLALGRARASSLSSDGSGSVLLLPGALPQSGLLGLKSSASLVRKQPLATTTTATTSGSAASSSPPVPRRGPASSSSSSSLEAPRLGKARALAVSPLAASQSTWRPQPLAGAAGSLSTSPRMVVPLGSESSASSSTSTSPSPSPRKASSSSSSKRGSRRRHSRSMNSTTNTAAANEPPSPGQRGAEAFERPRAYSAGPQLPPSRDKPKRKEKKERKDKTAKKEKKEKKEKEKKEKKEKKETKREKSSSSTGKRNSKGARLVRALSGGKLTRTGGGPDHDRIKRESFTGVNPALLSDSAAHDNPYIAEYRRERNTPRGGWPATPTTTTQAHEAVNAGARAQAENEDDREKNECAATADKNEVMRGAVAAVREAEEEVVEKKRRGTDSPRNGGSGRRQKTNGSSSSAASHSSGSGVALPPRHGVTSTSADSTGTSSVKPAIPVLSLGTMSAVRVEPHPHHADADTLGSEGSNSSSNAGSGIGSRLGAITPRMVEGFRSIVKKLGKNTTDDRIDRPAGEETHDEDGEESEESLSYSGSGSGSDSSESEEVRQRRRMRKRKLEKKRSMSERSLHRSRSLSPTRRTRDLLMGDQQPTSAMTTRGKRSGSTLHRESSCRAAPRKGGSERQPRTDRSGGDASWKRTKGESSLTSGGSSPLARSPAVARAAKSSSSARTSPVASPRDAVQRGGLRNSDSSSSSSDLSSSNERVERRGRTMARRAGDTWGNFLARLSPRTTPRPLHSATSSPNLTTAASSSSTSPVQRAEDDKAAKASSSSSSSRSTKKNKPTRTRSDDRIDWGKDRIHPPTSSASSSQKLPAGSAEVRSRSLSPVRRTDKVDRKGGKHRKRNH